MSGPLTAYHSLSGYIRAVTFPRTSLLYRALVRAGVALAPLAATRSPKVALGVRARRRLIARLETWAREHRDRARPLLWLHASSVGEGLQAESVLHLLREHHGDWQIAYTHFS